MVMGKDWLQWIGRGGEGGGGNTNRRRKKKEEWESASAGCISAVIHLFHSHHLHFPPSSSHRNHNHNSHPNNNMHPFLPQQPPTPLTGVEAPRNSLELGLDLEQQSFYFPLAGNGNGNRNGIQIKTKPRFDEISSECNSPAAAKTPIVARLMGLDLLPLPTTPPSNTFFHHHIAAGARSLPDTPRVSSSSSRRSDVDRHRLSLQLPNTTNQELPLSDHKTRGRRGRPKQNDENRNIIKHDRDISTTPRSVGLDITNTLAQSRRDENLLPTRKNSNNQILNAPAGRRSLTKPASASKHNHHIHIPSHKDCKKVNFRKSSSPPRAAAVRGRKESEFFRSRETNRSDFAGKTLQVKKLTKLPQKQSSSSQVSDALASKSSAQLSSIPSQSYSQLHLTPISPCTFNGGGPSPEQRNYIQTILKHTGIINQASPLSKWHTPYNPIDPGIFHRLELSSAADGGNSVLSLQCNRKLIFQLVDELLAEILTPRFSFSRFYYPIVQGGGFPLVEEICKKIESFPAAKCVVLEDIDSLIDRDFCKSRWKGYSGEEEEMVREIESEMVEWMVREAVAVMGDGGGIPARVLLGRK